MSLIIPFIYYSGITGWNGYLFYSRNSINIVLDGNIQEYDILFSAGKGLNALYSKGSGLIEMQVRFRNIQVNYFHPDGFYAVMGGVSGKWGKFFLGFNSDARPSLDILLDRTFRKGRYGLRIRSSGRYYGGYDVPLERGEAWGYRRHEIRAQVVYSVMLLGSYRLMERVLYAGFMPVGKKGVDLLAGVQYFNGHISTGAGVRFIYPVLGSFHVFAGVEPASGRWDIFVGVGNF